MPIRVGIDVIQTLDRGQAIEHVDGVIRVAVGTACLTFGKAMPTIVGTEDNIAIAGKAIDIGDVTLGRPIDLRRNVAVVEDDGRPAG